jgi:hypothetical protein
MYRGPRFLLRFSHLGSLQVGNVCDKLSERMKDRYYLLGSLPDVIEDEWIDDIDAMEQGLKKFT